MVGAGVPDGVNAKAVLRVLGVHGWFDVDSAECHVSLVAASDAAAVASVLQAMEERQMDRIDVALVSLQMVTLVKALGRPVPMILRCTEQVVSRQERGLTTPQVSEDHAGHL